MATNTKYDVMNMAMIDKSKVNFDGKKARAIVPANSSSNIDISFSDDVLITGACVLLSGNNPDDTFKFQVIHPLAGVLNQFIDWYAKDLDQDLLYPAKIPAGLIVRIIYENTGSSDVTIRVNYKVHKIVAIE